MTDDFSGRVGDALLGFSDAECPAPAADAPTGSRRLEAARSPEAELLDGSEPPAKLWDAIEHQLRDEGLIHE